MRGRDLTLKLVLGLSLGLALGLGLLACGPKEDASAKAPVLATKPELIQLERTGSAQPAASARKLQTLFEQEVPGSLAALNILSLRANLVAMSRDYQEVDRLVVQLEAWPTPGLQATAKAVALHARARLMLQTKNQSGGAKLLAEIDAEQLKRAPAPIRIRILRAQGRVLNNIGKVDEAISLQLEALRLAEQSGQVWMQSLCHTDLAQSYMHAEQMDRAKAITDAGLQLAEQDPDPMTLMINHNSRGIIYARLNQRAESQRSAEAAIRYAREAGSQADLALNLANLADNHLRNGDFAAALKASQEALPLAREAKEYTAEVVALANTGLAMISMGQVAEGKPYVLQAISMDRQQGSIATVGDELEELGQYLERAGDLAGAVEAYHEARDISEDTLKKDDRKTILEAQERFEAERRAKEIELLNRNSGIAAEQLRRGDLQLRLWALLAACFVVSGLLMALLYQRVRKTNAALATSNEQLKIQSEIDPLTGLANRRHFQLAIKRLAADGLLRGTVFLIDIDHFKRINDRFGHAAGDVVLVEVARRLREALRSDDLVVRWGGEEFLIVVESRVPETVNALAQRLLDMIATPAISYGEHRINVSASIGFASFPLEPHKLAVNWERAINLVDTVMYMAKAHGRNRAYGVNRVDLQDQHLLDELAQGMDAAWRDGQVGLTALQGPQREMETLA